MLCCSDITYIIIKITREQCNNTIEEEEDVVGGDNDTVESVLNRKGVQKCFLLLNIIPFPGSRNTLDSDYHAVIIVNRFVTSGWSW